MEEFAAVYTRVDAAEAHVPRRAPVLLAAVLSLVLVSLSLVHVRAPAPAEALPVMSTRTLGSAHCVFLHGAGSNETGPPTPTFPTYWGAVHDYTPACAHLLFLHADTLHQGWEDESLQRSVCELINAAARPVQARVHEQVGAVLDVEGGRAQLSRLHGLVRVRVRVSLTLTLTPT